MGISIPGSFVSEDFKKDVYDLLTKLTRTKDVKTVQGNVTTERAKLKKCLTILDLTSLGVGSCVGTGMYLVTGLVAKNYAGPGVVFSFCIAALASILSGTCYAEFAVRVPHTSGSAYMYSYVTVGELVAFVVGWNMILEYLIGTAACACALSACFDSLAYGALNETMYGRYGTILGHTPDFFAFVITLLMMTVLALGVKKSLIFNNLLNTINFTSWIFMLSAGLFYAALDNWSNFLPYGWSGVFEGAATCFYAFIGFDIIATTGEEAHNPKKSIPVAIVLSLTIILVAYLSSSMMLTLIVPFDDISENSALVAMFGQVGARKCQMVMMIGALAGLTVSMFGSMFPMPRIMYAMAKDGLLFGFLSPIFQLTGTPLVATVVSGVAAAFATLFLNLQILVEMMSIGTLLAYTLVSTCILIMRYQPYTSNIMELLPDALRTPVEVPSSPIEHVFKGQIVYDKESKLDGLETVLGLSVSENKKSSLGENSSFPNRKITVRRITRNSPDSDDSLSDENEGNYAAFDGRRLITADKREKKHYGTTLHRITPVPKSTEEKVNERMDNFKKRLQIFAYICPTFLPWVACGPATEQSGKSVVQLVFLLYPIILLFDVMMVYCSRPFSTLTAYFIYLLIMCIVMVTAAISRKRQNRKDLLFLTPAVPFVPVITIMVNIYLILNLSILTLIRFVVWMILGFIIYFYYGIKYSRLEVSSETVNYNVTTAMDPSTATAASSMAYFHSSVNINSHSHMMKTENIITTTMVAATTVSTASACISVARPTVLDPPKSTNARNNLFVSPSAFPAWDD